MNPTTTSKKTSAKRSSAHFADSTANIDPALDTTSPVASASPSTSSNAPASSTSNFRNVSACNRCRLRKNRCDQKLPACTSCEKAGVKCVGFDPVSKREIPRSYVYYLESRVAHLENLLQSHGIAFPPAEDFTLSVPRELGGVVGAGALQQQQAPEAVPGAQKDAGAGVVGEDRRVVDTGQEEQRDRERLNNLVGNIGVQGVSDSRNLGSTSGISFARVVFAAVKSSVSNAPSERGGGVRPSKPLPGSNAAGGTTMRDSFFGLHTKPTIHPAPFPDQELGQRLVDLYFEHSNPQIPTLHRGEFMTLLHRVYATEGSKRTARELYMLNIVFAIGSGIIMDSSNSGKKDASYMEHVSDDMGVRGSKRLKVSNQQGQPEEYHASAIVHLESFLGSSPAAEGVAGGLEELQAVLLLAGFALLRPVAPGLWYIIGVAVRLAVDLGLHNEEDTSADNVAESQNSSISPADQHKEAGRRQWTRDMRRRLWWCVYSFDRLVSTCVGRPFGITDQVVTTEFPSLLDDRHITTSGFLPLPDSGYNIPSYKYVSHHYFRLRLLQSEILQVLQHRQAQQVRVSGVNEGNQFMHTNLPSPFLQRFATFRGWRMDVDRRLWEWNQSAPTQSMTGVQFTPLFLELNYWQAVIMLYRQSLSVPAPLAGELGSSTGEDVSTPGHVSYEEQEDEDRVFMRVAEAGMKTLKIYRQLHRVRLVNYTFLATHHLFMSGISFLYALWHSPLVRAKLTLDDVDFTVLAATSVLGDLIEKCPPAEACRDAFDRMSKATISMCMKTTGFGEQATKFLPRRPPQSMSSTYFPPAQQQQQAQPRSYNNSSQTLPQTNKRPPPRFDMDFRGLFSDEELSIRSTTPGRSTYPSLTSLQQTPLTKRETSALSYQHQPQQPQQTQDPSPRLYNMSPPIDPSLQIQSPHSSHPSPSQQSRQAGGAYGAPSDSNFNPSSALAAPAQRLLNSNTASFGPQNLENLDFLNGFSTNVNSGLDGGSGAGDFEGWDIGFGAGGLAFDGGGSMWDDNGGFDLFDGFFFGGGASTAPGGAGGIGSGSDGTGGGM